MIPRMHIEILEPAEWSRVSKGVHLKTFNEIKSPDFERIDYAIVCFYKETALMYVTVKELDAETCYWQYGGNMQEPGLPAYKAFRQIYDFCKKRYKRIGFLVENDNFAMLKFAIAAKFLITGIRYFDGKVLLEHRKEF